ncbi:hypothetical protein WDW86_03805 [Bdellovibrionota bacterium FG-2]
MRTAHFVLPFFGLFSLSAFAVCPDPVAAETLQDCPWAEIARDFSSFEKAAPGLVNQIKADSTSPLRNLWGQSINYDELAKGVILSGEILHKLESLFGVPQSLEKAYDLDRSIAHAGLEHTYGYLFSLLKTSFGYKRARWVQGEIEKGFGLPAGLLSPTPSSGTLFSNASVFFGKIAFRNSAKEKTLLNKSAGTAAQAIREFNPTTLRTTRIEEQVEIETTTVGIRKVLLRTDLTPFTKGDGWLLVYSVVDSELGGARLITAFPIKSDFAINLLKPQNFGFHKDLTTRYNGYIRGLSGKNLPGKRILF